MRKELYTVPGPLVKDSPDSFPVLLLAEYFSKSEESLSSGTWIHVSIWNSQGRLVYIGSAKGRISVTAIHLCWEDARVRFIQIRTRADNQISEEYHETASMSESEDCSVLGKSGGGGRDVNIVLRACSSTRGGNFAG